MDFLHENDNEVVRNILDPELFVPDSFEAVPMGMSVTMIVGELRDKSLVQLQLNPGRKYVQGVKFGKPTWDVSTALEWLQENMKHFDKKESEAVKESYSKKTHNISGVEVFSVGTWNGQTFTEQDLDKMVESFKTTSDTVRPFLKLGHDDEQKLLQKEGLPAAGWVGNLYRKGGKLIADFVDIPKKIYELIEKKAYRKVSIELFKNVEILDKKFDFLISGVALLGAETPGVLNLNDILAQFKISGYDSRYTFTHEREAFVVSPKNPDGGIDMELKEALAQIGKLEEQLKQATAEKDKFTKETVEAKAAREKLEGELNDLKEKFTKNAADLKKAEIEKQVFSLEKDGLISPAMKPLVEQLLDADAQKFSIKKDNKDKEATRFEVLKEVFSLAKAAADVNVDAKTADGEGKKGSTTFEKIDAEIEKYSKENNCTYSEAYSAVAPKYEKELEAAE